MRHQFLGVVTLALCVLGAALSVDAAVCPQTGENAPEVVTLMASRTNPASDAWIVTPDCSVVVQSFSVLFQWFSAGRGDVERVDSVPSDTIRLSLGGTFSRGVDLLSATKLDKLSLIGTGATSIRNWKLPKSLTDLYMDGNKIAAIDFQVPPQLRTLDISEALVTKLERISFPDSLARIFFTGCPITSIRGVKWPASIEHIQFQTRVVVNFEIRRSDLPVFKSLSKNHFIADIVQPACADPTAEVAVVLGKRLCVISDARFEALYVTGGPLPIETPSSTETTSPTASTGSDIGASRNKTGGGGTTTKRPPTTSGSQTGGSLDPSTDPEGLPGSTNSDNNSGETRTPEATDTTTGSLPEESGNDANGVSPASPSTLKPSSGSPVSSGPKSSSTTEVVSTSASSNSTLILVVVGAGAILAVLIAVVGFRVFVASKNRQEDEDEEFACDKYSCAASTRAAPTTRDLLDEEPNAAASEKVYLSNDVRNDKALIPFRIEQSDVPPAELITGGGSYSIHVATFQGRNVAVKQLKPGGYKNERTLSQFMDEIRLCASLNHHKIVAFVGIAWSSVRDLSVVIELMSGGDLHTILQKQHDQQPSTEQDWSQPWTPSQINSKAAIAQDVAEAVVYLHSFNSPILHRNLKTRNVLLADDGSAKLSGFGISRTLSFDHTMTGEIGTAAWVAPEVLRGEQYSDKADIYSLGVLLVEMDSCQHPYANTSGQVYTNTQIAVLVSTGQLRPSVSSACPERVASLVNKCLSFDAADRPTSMEVYYGLRQARKAMQG